MPRTERVAAIQRIEQLRNSRVLAIVLGDRPNLETRMAMDLVPIAAKHLRAMGRAEKIDLFLYTLGGDIMAAFRLVGLIREYTDHFSVLVPFRCQSAGTLTALGADEIVMPPEGQLSPVDPSINGPYNPTLQMPAQPGNLQIPTLPVSVEEVVGYINLAREIGQIEGEGMVNVFERLTTDVRPMALGQVYRARTQIRMLSRKLLQFHMKADDTAIDNLIETLTEKLYSHDYLITRREAKQIGLKVVEPANDIEAAMVDLYNRYESDLMLRDPFNPASVITPARPQAKVDLERAIIESSGRADVFRTEATFAMVAPGNLQQALHYEGWKQHQ